MTARGRRRTGDLRPGTPVAYRAGDQPNNAFSLNVLEPGEVAATAGTSGVVYGVGDQATWDNESRVNTFLHVNHRPDAPRYGVLLCVNGTGSLNRWLKRTIGEGLSLRRDERAWRSRRRSASDGVVVLPVRQRRRAHAVEPRPGRRGLGPVVQPAHPGAPVPRRPGGHRVRAELRRGHHARRWASTCGRCGPGAPTCSSARCSPARSPTRRGAVVELFDTDGAQGAARAAGVGAGIFPAIGDAFSGLRAVRALRAGPGHVPQYRDAYRRWLDALDSRLSSLRSEP